MANKRFNLKDFGEGIAGAIIAATVFLSPFIPPRYSKWGATDDEVHRPLPGDDIVPRPKLEYTLAATVHASPAEIWPWIVQIGHGRGGMYSYELLENLFECDLHNADRINPQWQNLKVGDNVRMGPKGYPLFKVADIKPYHVLVLIGADPKTEQTCELADLMPDEYTNGSWVFFLNELSDRTTWLITRYRLDYMPESFVNVLIYRVLTDPVGFVMTRKMLLSIKQRAEVEVERTSSNNSHVQCEDSDITVVIW